MRWLRVVGWALPLLPALVLVALTRIFGLIWETAYGVNRVVDLWGRSIVMQFMRVLVDARVSAAQRARVAELDSMLRRARRAHRGRA